MPYSTVGKTGCRSRYEYPRCVFECVQQWGASSGHVQITPTEPVFSMCMSFSLQLLWQQLNFGYRWYICL